MSKCYKNIRSAFTLYKVGRCKIKTKMYLMNKDKLICRCTLTNVKFIILIILPSLSIIVTSSGDEVRNFFIPSNIVVIPIQYTVRIIF